MRESESVSRYGARGVPFEPLFQMTSGCQGYDVRESTFSDGPEKVHADRTSTRRRQYYITTPRLARPPAFS